MKTILELLLAFFRFGVDDPAAPADGADPAAPADPDQPELDLGADDPEPEPEGDPQVTSREELETAQREARESRERAERAEREAADYRARAHRPVQDEQFAREDAILADPNATDLQKWQVTANRELRAGRSQAQAALMQATDVSDRTAFAAIAMTDPVAKKYEVRVEKELAEYRAKGQNPTREALYTYMLGKDMREGKFKKKAAAPAPARPAVDRGRLPGARSDLPSKPGTMTNRERLAKKLDGVQI